MNVYQRKEYNKVATKLISDKYQCYIDPNGYTAEATGAFIPNLKRIIIKKNDVWLLFHEIGHYVDQNAGIINGKVPYQGIYNEERNKAPNPVNHKIRTSNSGVSEYFAEAFAEYMLDNIAFKKACPKTYDIVSKAIKSY